jgi:hypothetical protein
MKYSFLIHTASSFKNPTRPRVILPVEEGIVGRERWGSRVDLSDDRPVVIKKGRASWGRTRQISRRFLSGVRVFGEEKREARGSASTYTGMYDELGCIIACFIHPLTVLTLTVRFRT